MSQSNPTSSIENDKNRELLSYEIANNFICLRGLSKKRYRFEIEYALEKGSSTNTFLILNEKSNEEGINDSAYLIHPPGAPFSKLLLDKLEEILDNYATKLYIIVGHVNPSRVSFLKQLCAKYKNTTLICSSPGAKLIKEIWLQKPPSKPSTSFTKIDLADDFPAIQSIKGRKIQSLGNGYNLELIPTPTARWPGGLIVFEHNLGLLISGKLFGAHICSEEWAEVNSSSTEEERRHYFDCLMAPMASQVNSVIENIEDLDIRSIAPGHGPAIENSWRSLICEYRRWGDNQITCDINVVLLFASAYGNTAAIADALARGINKTSVKVSILNCEFIPTEELIKAIKLADAYLIGSPTLGGHAPTPIVSALGTLISEGDHTKKVGIFGSYGWSGEALDLLENKLKDAGFSFGFDPIKVNFSPDVLTVKKLEETGTSFGRKLIQEKKRNQRRTPGGINESRNDPSLLALGRIVGSLCVLTAVKGTESSQLNGAMIASWISQASFSPPGLTIAVAKDRAIEALLHSEDLFAINIIAQGRQNEIMKQFLQPFKPGADRFAGVDLETSPGGQPILPDSLAWLEGKVKQRMECGDHWLIYAEISHGKVIDSNSITAVHHRTSGSNY